MINNKYAVYYKTLIDSIYHIMTRELSLRYNQRQIISSAKSQVVKNWKPYTHNYPLILYNFSKFII